MPSAPTNRRGLDLNCRFAVNGIQKDSRLLGEGSKALGVKGCAAALAVADMALVLGASGGCRTIAMFNKPNKCGRMLTIQGQFGLASGYSCSLYLAPKPLG